MPAELSAKARVTHHFAASAERVFDAWLDPDLLGRWMFGLGGRDEEVIRIHIDPRVGGRFSFLIRRDGQEIDHVGRYLEVERPRRVAFTWATAPEPAEPSEVTIEFEPEGTGCVVTLTHAMAAEYADFVERAEGSWSAMLAAMDAIL